MQLQRFGHDWATEQQQMSMRQKKGGGEQKQNWKESLQIWCSSDSVKGKEEGKSGEEEPQTVLESWENLPLGAGDSQSTRESSFWAEMFCLALVPMLRQCLGAAQGEHGLAWIAGGSERTAMQGYLLSLSTQQILTPGELGCTPLWCQSK